ncbi:PREDICTED: 5-formyltetrahydrofolate cyclo-ligase [Dufourea novaeangliae]|uniref:5-formyltetrahydrofolate cyclo-ligase n=1 Tax=Dufourea novaeangliae TaxID=178035 RepID=A0A154PMF8_DUFNO|nr:PREDICTED: 5-formyltetrahydrofolate cyclo-ligase [Dufourea novaeangliae]KZC13023.1 5-formyltetrahydrofolate cyclo-ligase [Dufourea novaeangliae]
MCRIKCAKLILRKKMKLIISQLSPEEKDRQSRKLFGKLCGLQQFQQSRRISLFLSTKDEVNTIPILKHLFATKKEVFVPTYRGLNMEMVKLLSMEDYEKLPVTKWNIKQPKFTETRENALKTGGLDLIILPGVAFTIDGKRLGHGMGYYDSFLNACLKKQQTKPYLIGVAFNEQIWEDIPTSDTDVPVDLVLTENTFILR